MMYKHKKFKMEFVEINCIFCGEKYFTNKKRDNIPCSKSCIGALEKRNERNEKIDNIL